VAPHFAGLNKRLQRLNRGRVQRINSRRSGFSKPFFINGITMEPKIAQKGPFVLDLKPGTYWWCACGQSRNQPFCDGSHKGSGFEPIKFEVTTAGRHAMCGCKHSAKKPFCDGTHNKL
jgi:CDGSH-type Zn-finger protein